MSLLPRISLVTCSFQQGRFLDATLRSVLDQEYPALEYIVMDGGSRDGSAEIVAARAPQLAHWVSEKDDGQTDALIRGFEHSTGSVMGWLCSDDLLLPGALEAVGRFFADNPGVDAVYGDGIWIDEHGVPMRTKCEMGFNRFVFLFDHNYLPQPSLFWRRSLYERAGGLDRGFDLAMDSDLWERFSRHGRIAHVRQYWSAMRSYGAQKTQALRPAGRVEDATIRARHPLGRYHWSARVLHPVARSVRVASRLVQGCYGAPIPEVLRTALRRYEIPAQP